jgi:hypothetical protein
MAADGSPLERTLNTFETGGPLVDEAGNEPHTELLAHGT